VDLPHDAILYGNARIRGAEISPWQEGDEVWHGLRAMFPNGIASQSKEQDFYFGDDFLLRRHDYLLY
jgi:hypothetical protein